jgi:phosphate starvation-inducible protein PhoH
MANKKKQETYDVVPETLKDSLFYGLQLDEKQTEFRDAIWNPDKKIIFVNASAGSGKTLIAFATANLLYQYGLYDGIIYVVSPYGEAKQGFLPGDITEKSEVYFEPLYQAMIKCNVFPSSAICDESMTSQKQGTGYVKCLTHTYLRGTNFENKVVILDEAQNNTFPDLKKILTRVNDDCKVIVIGHNLQKDIDDKKDSFVAYMNYFASLHDERVAICELTKNYRGWISATADAFEI